MRKCQQAGITVRMITGDNLLTAKSISREIGILTDGCAIEGPDFRRLDPDGQREVLKTMQVPRLGGFSCRVLHRAGGAVGLVCAMFKKGEAMREDLIFSEKSPFFSEPFFLGFRV